MLNHVGTVILRTKRFILRRFRDDDDIKLFNNFTSSYEVTKFLPWKPHKNLKITDLVLHSWIKEYSNIEYYNWAICLNDTDEPIGSINITSIDNYNENCEVGFCLSKEYWNHKIMTEVLNEVIRFAFSEVGFVRISARHAAKNIGCEKLLENVGFKYEGTLRKIIKLSDGKYTDCKYYSILKTEMEIS
ncbi:GNAT family N-acetyltransferase [Clostridium sp. BJN0001]|uniref:GNAT family N-acetyltransferase n=1 Tax=Clostridium sp. BJN0001 TaxID=2930219 RepID=UPI001FD44EF6|nr:GNAT family N-acetyltransferase [Clostridium sp. BJN0001]